MPAERTMGADHIGEAGGSFEPQRPFNFILVLPQDKLASKEDVELSVLSFSVPDVSNEEITIPFLNEERKVPGPVTFAAATLIVVDYVDPNTLANLMQWRDLVYDGGEDGDGGIGLSRDIKGEADMKMFGPNSRDSFSRLWHMVGIWPKTLKHGEFNMGTRTDYKQITVEFAVDRMYLQQQSASA